MTSLYLLTNIITTNFLYQLSKFTNYKFTITFSYREPPDLCRLLSKMLLNHEKPPD